MVAPDSRYSCTCHARHEPPGAQQLGYGMAGRRGAQALQGEATESINQSACPVPYVNLASSVSKFGQV
jgi:hypothetical protein